VDNKTLLQNRINRFDNLCSTLECFRPTPLSAIVDIEDTTFENLKTTAKIYLSKVLKSNNINLSSDEIVKKFNDQRETIPNVTPTGMILPKKYSTIEYNLLMRTFYDTVSSTLKIDDKINHWHIPMHIRVKYPESIKTELQRPRHAPEHIHMDSWSSYSSFGVTCIIPLFGDLIKNSLDFWELTGETYKESWITPPIKSDEFDWEKQKEIAKNYKKVEYERKPKQMFLFDASTVHATHREKGCGTRFSIDNIFIPKVSVEEKKYEKVSKERQLETRTHSKLLTIGEKELFTFPDDDNIIRDTKGGSMDPINWEILTINEESSDGRFKNN